MKVVLLGYGFGHGGANLVYRRFLPELKLAEVPA